MSKWPLIFKMASEKVLIVHISGVKSDKIMILVSKCILLKSRNPMEGGLNCYTIKIATYFQDGCQNPSFNIFLPYKEVKLRCACHNEYILGSRFHLQGGPV